MSDAEAERQTTTRVKRTPVPLGAQALRWATPAEMRALPFCEADLPFLELLASDGGGKMEG